MKTLKNISIVFILLISYTLTAQENSIFKDDFDGTSTKWFIGDNDRYELKLFNGRYYFTHKNTEKNLMIFSPNFTMDKEGDFEIISSVQKISGPKNDGYGIFLQKENKDRIELQITSTGFFQINHKSNGNYKTIHKWEKSSKIKTGNFAVNTFEIKKEGSKVSFYINNSLLATKTLSGIYGKNVGYIVNKNQKISIDYLYVNKLAKQENTYVNNNTITNNDFIEDFNNNNNRWGIKNSPGIVNFSIKNSTLVFDHLKEKGGYETSMIKAINTDKDFTIETKIDKISGPQDKAFGLMWGKGKSKNFEFLISGNGYYQINRFDGKTQSIVKWTATGEIRQGNGSTNILRVEKRNGHYYFYVNNQYINEIPYENFYGDRMGFVVYGNQKLVIDYLKVSKPNKQNNNNFVAKKTLQLPLIENFDNNNNNWVQNNNDNFTSKVSGGKYQLTRKIKNGLVFQNKIDIDTQKDFSIEASFTKETGALGYTYGLNFGRKNTANDIGFFISNNGQYIFRKYENNNFIAIIPWTSSSAIKTNLFDTNKLKVVKKGKLMRFYINDIYVNEAPFQPFFGKEIGFSIYNKQTVSVDFLRVKYLNNSHNSPPLITITEPNVEAKRGFNIVKAKNVTVRGKATDNDGIYEIIINGVEANVNEDGSFMASVPLKYGKNDLIVKATDIKQMSSSKRFVIKRSSANTNINVTNNTQVNNNVVLNSNDGNYHALIIGVSEYEDDSILDLEGKPTKDAQTLANILTTKYAFDKGNVTVLKNPTENDINKEFFRLRKEITENDNLLVFYAGHGEFDKENNIGFWLPADTQLKYNNNIIENSRLVGYFKSIKSKHTLLISDACFSGSIFDSSRSIKRDTDLAIQKKYSRTSRRAMTSGAKKTVPNQSVFFQYLIKRLKEFDGKYLPAKKLFDSFEDAVINNTDNIPQYGPIKRTGDEGGDFIFIKRN